MFYLRWERSLWGVKSDAGVSCSHRPGVLWGKRRVSIRGIVEGESAGAQRGLGVGASGGVVSWMSGAGGGWIWWSVPSSCDCISPVGGATTGGRGGGSGTIAAGGWVGGFMGIAGADGGGCDGNAVRGSWMGTGGLHTGVYFRRNLRLRNVTLPDPSTLMTYWSNCLTSMTRPVLSHFLGWGPVWFCRRT